ARCGPSLGLSHSGRHRRLEESGRAAPALARRYGKSRLPVPIEGVNGSPIFRLTRVTRIFQKKVFTETTPGARAACRAGFFVARAARAAARRVSRVCRKNRKIQRRSKPCRFKRAKAEIRPDGRAGSSIGQLRSRKIYCRNVPRGSRAR